MALNKAKAIETAQKLVAQGKLKEAANEYLKIHKQDARDQTVLNTLGDLYVRLNNLPEALNYYGKLADMYVSDGFLVRGIAMYKKIGKLDPQNPTAMERLADLYTMQGLMTEARIQYLQLAEAHLKASQTKRAIDVMNKVLDLDPDNVKIQQRLADLYERHGQQGEAAQIYRRLAERQLHAGQSDEAVKWATKAGSLAPEDAEVLLLQAQLQQRQGKTDEALATLGKVPHPEQHPEALRLRMNVHLEKGDTQAARDLAEKLFAADPANFTALLQLAQHAAEQKDAGQALSLLKRVTEPALQHDALTLLSATRTVSSLLPESVEAAELFIEGARKAEQAEVLVEALGRRAQLALATEDWARAKELYDELVSLQPEVPEFSQQLKRVREKLGEPSVVAGVAEAAPPSFPGIGEPSPPVEGLDEETQAYLNASMTDIDLFSSYGMTDKAIELAQQVLERVPNHLPVLEKLLDFYLGSSNDQGVVEIARRLAPLYRDAGNDGRADEVEDIGRRYGEKIDKEAAAEAAPPEAGPSEPALHEVDLSAEWASASNLEEATEVVEEAPAAPAFSAEEAIQEVDFYLSQGLPEEARTALARYEQVFPGEPALAELRTRVESAAAAAPAAPAESAPAEPTPAPPAAPEAPAPEEGVTYEVTLKQEPSATAPSAGTPMSADQFFSDMASDLDQALEQTAPPPTEPATPAPPAAEPVAPSPAPAPAPAATAGLPKGEAGILAEVFEEFKQELGEIEEVEDVETHYNLGIAYKEMGLLEEAISEFQKVVKAGAPTHLFQVCTLLGVCFMEKGLPQIAVRWYDRALKAPGLDEEGTLALRYDMGVAHEQAGNRQAALECFMEVYGTNVDYRNVGERIRELQGS